MEKLTFKLKGSRDYIQGPDVYNEIEKILNKKKITYFELSFHNIMKNNIILSDKKPNKEQDLYFLCRYIENDNTKELYGIKDESSKPNESIIYEEELITQNAIFNEKDESIILNSPSKFTLMEEIVALNKYLVQQTIQKQKKGKWYFAKFIHSNLLPERSYPLEIRLKTNFNFLLSKSEIILYKEGVATGGGHCIFWFKEGVIC